jgi:hypothetical protein
MELDLSKMGNIWSIAGTDLNIVLSEILGTAWYLIRSPAIIDLQQKLSPIDAEIIQFPKPRSGR